MEIQIKSAKQIIENKGNCCKGNIGSATYVFCVNCPHENSCPRKSSLFITENHQVVLEATKQWLAKNEPIYLKNMGWRIGKSGNPAFDICIQDTDGGSICHFTRWTNAEENAKKMVMADEMLEVLIQSVKLEVLVLEKKLNIKISKIEQIRDDIYGDGPLANECVKDIYIKMKTVEKATGKKWEDIKNG